LSDDRPELAAIAELEEVLGKLTGELAAWRRRALQAEASRSELGADHDAVASRERIVDLEDRNGDLENRLEQARERVSELLRRLRFLEEQAAVEGQSR
jgi:chromosome segregation ATPase